MLNHLYTCYFPICIVILYNCAELADGCSSCLGSGFECGWCDRPSGMTDSCTYTEECETTPVNVGSNCPAPMITDFNPKSGPIEGGTTITITGRELGVTFDDFITNSITVGSVSCTAIESGYIPGRQIRCNTTAQGGLLGDLPIVITLPSGTGESSDRFTYATPEIMRVVPIRGPVAGGTRLTVWGSNLNIGNIEDTRITIVDGTECNIVE